MGPPPLSNVQWGGEGVPPWQICAMWGEAFPPAKFAPWGEGPFPPLQIISSLLIKVSLIRTQY